MKCVKTLLIAVLGINFGFAQTIKTKDGVEFGLRKDFISSCITGCEEKTMNVNGV